MLKVAGDQHMNRGMAEQHDAAPRIPATAKRNPLRNLIFSPTTTAAILFLRYSPSI